ncbi:lipopolysaccharide biosynthesis protein [Bacilli bacterium]|nr:lipopolysaccharide biosynthesis protein [Bacilli bacterium VT-13-104]PZD84327.1 lipopolysaccharide biosynthesis protein [Bacilli bacterium]PZD86020.1 lipopolysaccharide biosynthesis protein [Bacilli bacterium]PZD89242.1 lipopolysaccharide biosynthesis protein [Bacilli bacterium]RCO05208.1 lipopolysaccharide biosynthesis protein [Bacilli bacterium]
MSTNKQLQKKTLNGLIWSFVDLMANQGIQFIIMIILARLLLPEHFGLLGMVMIFVALSQTVVDSGFSQALIREKNVERIDYSTTFIVNIVFSIFIYTLIYFIAPLVSQFYSESQITRILRVIGLVVFFQAISIVPRTILTRNVDFKTQTKVSITASISSGIIAITLALAGYGVWALVYRIVIQKAVESLMLNYVNRWKPVMEFSVLSFKKFYSFGWKLLISGLIDTIYQNIYYVIIGRMYMKRDLGLYTNARQIRDALNKGVTSSIQRVTYPVLSSIQSEEERLKYGFKKVIRLTAYVFFPIMLGIAAIADSLLVLLLGQKWESAVLYFQLLCVAAILFPMHAINLNILKVKGRSDLFLRLEIIKKVMTTVALIITIFLNLGVASFIVTAIITNHLSLLINTYYSGKEIEYGTIEQIKDLLPSYINSFLMAIIVYYIGHLVDLPLILIVVLQVIIGVITYFFLSRIFKVPELVQVFKLINPILLKVLKGRA